MKKFTDNIAALHENAAMGKELFGKSAENAISMFLDLNEVKEISTKVKKTYLNNTSPTGEELSFIFIGDEKTVAVKCIAEIHENKK